MRIDPHEYLSEELCKHALEFANKIIAVYGGTSQTELSNGIVQDGDCCPITNTICAGIGKTADKRFRTQRVHVFEYETPEIPGTELTMRSDVKRTWLMPDDVRLFVDTFDAITDDEIKEHGDWIY